MVRNPDGTLTFVSVGIMCVQWWPAFWRRPGLLVISTTLRVLLIPSTHADIHIWSAEKWPCLNLTCLTACHGHAMFASQRPSDCDFLTGVCLHCREMSIIYMRHWKQKTWVWIWAMWLQVVMSVSRCTLLRNVWPLVVQFNILVTSVLPNSNIRWKMMGCIINSDCISAPFSFCWTCLVHKEFQSSNQTFVVGGPGWFGIRLFATLIRNTCMFLIISAIVHKD